MNHKNINQLVATISVDTNKSVVCIYNAIKKLDIEVLASIGVNITKKGCFKEIRMLSSSADYIHTTNKVSTDYIRTTNTFRAVQIAVIAILTQKYLAKENKK